MVTLTISRDDFAPVDCMRNTVIIHSRLAWRYERVQAAVANRHGLQALPIEGLAARLAGGFLQPIAPDALKAAITKALAAELGDHALDRVAAAARGNPGRFLMRLRSRARHSGRRGAT